MGVGGAGGQRVGSRLGSGDGSSRVGCRAASAGRAAHERFVTRLASIASRVGRAAHRVPGVDVWASERSAPEHGGEGAEGRRMEWRGRREGSGRGGRPGVRGVARSSAARAGPLRCAHRADRIAVLARAFLRPVSLFGFGFLRRSAQRDRARSGARRSSSLGAARGVCETASGAVMAVRLGGRRGAAKGRARPRLRCQGRGGEQVGRWRGGLGERGIPSARGTGRRAHVPRRSAPHTTFDARCAVHHAQYARTRGATSLALAPQSSILPLSFPFLVCSISFWMWT